MPLGMAMALYAPPPLDSPVLLLIPGINVTRANSLIYNQIDNFRVVMNVRQSQMCIVNHHEHFGEHRV